jgi:hypothetical protein
VDDVRTRGTETDPNKFSIPIVSIIIPKNGYLQNTRMIPSRKQKAIRYIDEGQYELITRYSF